MGIKGWYLTPDNTVSSNYTEFNPISDSFPVSSYTDFTAMQTYTPVRKRTVRKPSVKAIKTVKTGTQKKSHAGRKILCAFGVLAIVLTSVAGTWYYLNGNDDLKAAAVFEAGSKTKNKNTSSDTDKEDLAGGKVKDLSDKKHTKTNDGISYSKSSPAYTVAENIMSTLWCDNDVDTAREIFNWVHSNVYYQAMTSELSFEDAAYRGFTRKSGDCYVYFACAKMLLDCAGIPNMMVRRSPVTRNGHYWHLVYLNGEWWHCDSTVFRNHPGVYFMLTDDQIRDSNHQFDGSLYPMRAGGSTEYKPSDTPTPTIDPNATPTPDPNATTAPVPTVSVTPSPSGNATVTPSPSDVKDSPTPTPENTNTDTPTPTEAQATPSDTPAPTPPPKETDVTETTAGEG